MCVPALCSCLALIALAGCNQPAADTRAADAQAIKDLDTQWSKTAATHDVDATVAYYSDDASVLPPNAPLATTKEAIRAGWAEILAPGSDISWQSNKVEVASSGDLAYDVGSYTMTTKDAQGHVATDHEKYTEVWKKEPDGKWKTVADVWNSDLPLATAPAPEITKKK
jgi:uncharacterized protein (TIGR02246 family)